MKKNLLFGFATLAVLCCNTICMEGQPETFAQIQNVGRVRLIVEL